jgi:hypothetical protein
MSTNYIWFILSTIRPTGPHSPSRLVGLPAPHDSDADCACPPSRLTGPSAPHDSDVRPPALLPPGLTGLMPLTTRSCFKSIIHFPEGSQQVQVHYAEHADPGGIDPGFQQAPQSWPSSSTSARSTTPSSPSQQDSAGRAWHAPALLLLSSLDENIEAHEEAFGIAEIYTDSQQHIVAQSR